MHKTIYNCWKLKLKFTKPILPHMTICRSILIKKEVYRILCLQATAEVLNIAAYIV